MDDFLYFIRDNLFGTHYFIYTFILSILLFAIIGYLFKEKYGKLEIVFEFDQTKTNKQNDSVVKNKKEKVKKGLFSSKKVKNNNSDDLEVIGNINDVNTQVNVQTVVEQQINNSVANQTPIATNSVLNNQSINTNLVQEQNNQLNIANQTSANNVTSIPSSTVFVDNTSLIKKKDQNLDINSNIPVTNNVTSSIDANTTNMNQNMLNQPIPLDAVNAYLDSHEETII